MAMRWRGLATTWLHGDVAARLLGEVDARPCGGEGTWLRAWVVLGILSNGVATKTSLKTRIRAASNFVPLIQCCSIRQIMANFSRIEF